VPQPQADNRESIPPVKTAQPLYSKEQIDALVRSGDPEAMKTAQQMVEKNREMQAPQTFTSPTGDIWAGNPYYTGMQKTGIPGKPSVEQIPLEANGFKTMTPYAWAHGPSGQLALQGIPFINSGAQPPQQAVPGVSTSGVNVPPLPPSGSSPQDYAQWAPQYKAASEAMTEGQKDLERGRAKIQTEAMEAGSKAPQTLQNLLTMRDAYDQGTLSGGSLAEHWLSARNAISEALGIDQKDLTASNIVEKLTTGLANNATRELSSRAAVQEVIMNLRASPGLRVNNESAVYLLDLLRQQEQQKIALGQLAAHTDSPKEFLAKQKEFYEQNPLVSPFTGKPIVNKDQSKEEIDAIVARSRGKQPQAAPQETPNPPQGGIQENTIIRNPQTQERRIFRGGQWQKL
jgi:hypothetical protein